MPSQLQLEPLHNLLLLMGWEYIEKPADVPFYTPEVAVKTEEVTKVPPRGMLAEMRKQMRKSMGKAG